MTTLPPAACACHSDDSGIAMPDFKHRPLELPVLEGNGVLPVCSNCRTMNIYLRKDDGSRFCFKMTPKAARSLARSLLNMSKHITKKGSMCPQCGLQRLKSSGSPHAVGSPKEGQVV